MAEVIVRDVYKAYGSVRVLRGVSIDMQDGEFVVLVGPSGCGKSTLLRMIAGLEEINAGDILIGDRVVNDIAPKDRDIAMVFQSYALYPHMTVASNMGFSLELARKARDLVDQVVGRVAGTLGLGDLMARYPKELSGGQRQRVAMGRAIVRQPKVFLFDEPLSNLDAKLRVQMRTEIKSLHHKMGTTAIYVTHDQVEAMTMADRIVVMNEGIIQQVGRPLDVYDTPSNLFVAGFIGSPGMNLLEGIAHRGENAWVEMADGTRLPAPQSEAEDGQAVVYGVRPEALVIDETAATGLMAEVEVMEPTGLSTLVFARIADYVTCAFTMDRLALSHGQRIGLVPDMARVHMFDKATGSRL
ncbi:MAG: ABC transporter ATP-binding protein [Alphaproteobacteria bacterium]